MKNVKTIGALLLCLGLLSPASVLYAAPQGGKVVGGKASITQSGATTTINQTTDRSVINWHSFNIGQNEKFLHNMPSKNSAGLHRVVGGGGASQIQGLLQSNGNIFVVNPAGVVIHKGAKVDTNSFLATTRDITDDNFMKGNMVFDKPGLANAQIINQGTITVNDRGLAALVAPTVRNEGLIVGKLGKVALASGDSTWKLDMYGDDLISFTVDEKAVNGLYAPSGQTLGVENTGTIKAEGGVVVLTAAQLDGIVGSVVNSGEISASSAEIAGGKITFKGQGDSITLANTGKVDAASTTSKGGSVKMVAENDIKVSGKIDVNGGTAGGDVYIWSDKKTTFDGQIEAKGQDKGGFVETSGNYLKVADSARVNTLADSGKNGKWLLDPKDFTISATGGDMSGSTISANLSTGDVDIVTSTMGTKEGNGDIIINDAIRWSSDNTLSLEAEGNIEINADITASGNNAGLSMVMPTGNYLLNDAKITLSGTTPRLSIDGVSYTVINSLHALQAINNNLDINYALGSDIDASATSQWNEGEGFRPIRKGFSGCFYGFGHKIKNLTINTPDVDNVGLFSFIKEHSVIRDLSLSNVEITGGFYVGGLVGWVHDEDPYFDEQIANIYNVHVTGKVTGYEDVGGLVGLSNNAIINKCSMDGTIEGDASVGGLVAANHGTIMNSMSLGEVIGRGASDVGGFAGRNTGNISNSFSSAKVTAYFSPRDEEAYDSPSMSEFYEFCPWLVGGFVGSNSGPISECYSSGNVTGNMRVGGFVGENDSIISNCYTTSNVTGNMQVGGFAGVSYDGGRISKSYSAGSVAGNEYVGGFVGTDSLDDDFDSGETYNCFWNVTTSGQSSSAGGVGLSASQMTNQSSFTGWDFEEVWKIEAGKTYPQLRNVGMNADTIVPDNPQKPEEEQDTPVVPPVTPEEPMPDSPTTPDESGNDGATPNQSEIGDTLANYDSIKNDVPHTPSEYYEKLNEIKNSLHDALSATAESDANAIQETKNWVYECNTEILKIYKLKAAFSSIISTTIDVGVKGAFGLADAIGAVAGYITNADVLNAVVNLFASDALFNESIERIENAKNILQRPGPLSLEDWNEAIDALIESRTYYLAGMNISQDEIDHMAHVKNLPFFMESSYWTSEIMNDVALSVISLFPGAQNVPLDIAPGFKASELSAINPAIQEVGSFLNSASDLMEGVEFANDMVSLTNLSSYLGDDFTSTVENDPYINCYVGIKSVLNKQNI